MKKIISEWKWSFLGLLVVAVIAFAFRFWNLTSIPVFADEAIYVRWSQVMKAESTLRFLPLSDGKPPLFMWVVIPFLKIFSDPLFAGRFVSVLTGVGTTAGVFVASYLLFKNKTASLMASILYALSPFAIFFDRMALADSMLSFFGVWIFIGGILTAKTLRTDIAMITGFLLGGALLTKSPALYFSLLLPVLVFFVNKKKDILKFLFLLVPTYLIAYGMYNILKLGPNFHMLALRNLDYVYPVSHILTSPLDPLRPFINMILEYYWMFGIGTILILLPLGIFFNFKNNFKEILIVLMWLLFPIIASAEFSKTMTARYIFFSLPFFMVTAASIFVNKSKWVRFLSYTLLLTFVFQSINFNFKIINNPQTANLPRSERSGYLEEWTSGYGIMEVSNFIKSEAAKDPSKRITVGTEGFFGTLPDGLLIYLTSVPHVTTIGVGLNFDTVSDQLTNSFKSGSKTYLVVNSDRYNGDGIEDGLKLVASYPKAFRPDGTRQELYLFELTKIVNKK